MDCKNKEEVKKYHQQYRALTWSRRKECQDKYRENNRDILKIKCKEYRSKKALEESEARNNIINN